MPAFCFHFLTLMDITCSTIISTTTHLEWLNTYPNKMTDIRKDLLLIMLEANKIQLLWSLTDHTHKVLQHAPQALMKGSNRVLSSKGIYPMANGEMFVWLTSAHHDKPLLSAAASKSLFIAVPRHLKSFKSPRIQLWLVDPHKNGRIWVLYLAYDLLNIRLNIGPG